MNKSKLREQIVLHEGLRLEAYKDTVGVWTIGVGRNMETNPVSDELGRTVNYPGGRITRDEAMILLDNDLNGAIADVRRNISFFDSLSEPRQMVLVDMAFNLGMRGLLGFRNMLSAVQSGDYARAAAEMLNSRWANQVGRRARTLSDMMENNRYFDGMSGPATSGSRTSSSSGGSSSGSRFSRGSSSSGSSGSSGGRDSDPSRGSDPRGSSGSRFSRDRDNGGSGGRDRDSGRDDDPRDRDGGGGGFSR